MAIFATNTLSALNTNSLGATTASIDITERLAVAWTIQGATGDHDNHKIMPQYSLDNSNWMDSGSGLTGTGVFAIREILPVGYIRFKVSVVEGTTSTVNIIVNCKSFGADG